ncbi:MAG: hypothetical protein RLZZ546_554 [Bacteroidota bacterium]|jgi:hypothetical protein
MKKIFLYIVTVWKNIIIYLKKTFMPKKILDTLLLQEIKNFRSTRNHIADIAHNINEGTNNNFVGFEIRFNEGSSCKVKVYPYQNQLNTDYSYSKNSKNNAYDIGTVMTETADFIAKVEPHILDYYIKKAIIVKI